MNSLKYLQQTTYKLKYILKMSHYNMNLNLLTNVDTSTINDVAVLAEYINHRGLNIH